MAVARRKRPWYLGLALVGCLALGSTGACSGWGTVALYRGPVDASFYSQGVTNPVDRERVTAQFDAYLHALDAAKSRGWPLAVATLLLGTAVFVAAIRALGGSRGARNALVQLVIAQAGTYAASYWLMGDVLEANLRLIEVRQAADPRQNTPDPPRGADEEARMTARLLRGAIPIEVALRTLGSALIVVALSRKRSRDFFQGSTEAAPEP